MKKNFVNWLKNSDELKDFEKEYILQVVNYIDSNMLKLENNNSTMAEGIDKMLELIGNIRSCNTGNDIIDNIVALRRKHIISELGKGYDKVFFETCDIGLGGTYSYIDNFIAILSDYGGVYSYVLKTYSDTLKESKVPTEPQGNKTHT